MEMQVSSPRKRKGNQSEKSIIGKKKEKVNALIR
jgi:hypothetical protein